MPFYQDLLNTNLDYTIGETVVLSFLAVVSGFGVALIILIVLPNLRKSDTPSTNLIISQLGADFCLCANVFVISVWNCINQRWSWGPEGCLVNSAFTIGSCYSSVLSLLFVSIERYRAGILGKPFQNWEVQVVIVSIWLVSWVVMGTIAIYTRNYPRMIGLHPSKFYCSIMWHYDDALTKTIFLVSAAILALTLLFIIYTYVNLFNAFSRVNRAMEDSFNRSVMFESDILGAHERKVHSITSIKRDERERELFMKAIVMAGSFFILWFAFFLKILVEFINKSEVNSTWDTIAAAGLLFHSALSPIIVYVMDHRIRNQVKEFIGIH
jgi:hypothetical protein